MYVSTIHVICYYNENLLRTKTDVKYVTHQKYPRIFIIILLYIPGIN